MHEGILYTFEELTDDLPRPPLVAIRALLAAGVIASPKGWTSLPIETRVAIAKLGLDGVVDTSAVRALAQQIPPRYLKLVSRSRDPNPDRAPQDLVRVLGPARPLTDTEWRSLRAVDRAVLASLCNNARLASRAYDELAVAMGKPPSMRMAKWTGAIAHCELHTTDAAIDQMVSPSFLDGRALMLARVAGIRAARKVAETLDLHAESATGPVELEAQVHRSRGRIVWQAHVSTWDGAFFPAAAMIAATTAAAALFDMIKDEDPKASVEAASIREEAWMAGAASSDEESTQLYAPGGWEAVRPKRASKGQIQELIDRASAPQGEDLGATIVDLPDAPATPAVPEDRRVPTDGPARDTVKDVAPNLAPMIDHAAAQHPAASESGSTPLVDLGPPVQARPSAPSSGPVSSNRERLPSAPHPGSRTPRALVAMFAASLVILAVALAIFGYVLSRSL